MGLGVGELSQVFSGKIVIKRVKNAKATKAADKATDAAKEAKIPDLTDGSLSLEKQAKQAFELRNKFRTEARELMADRNLATSLNLTEPNLTWGEIVAKGQKKGLYGDDLYKEIIKSSPLYYLLYSIDFCLIIVYNI